MPFVCPAGVLQPPGLSGKSLRPRNDAGADRGLAVVSSATGLHQALHRTGCPSKQQTYRLTGRNDEDFGLRSLTRRYRNWTRAGDRVMTVMTVTHDDERNRREAGVCPPSGDTLTATNRRRRDAQHEPGVEWPAEVTAERGATRSSVSGCDG